MGKTVLLKLVDVAKSIKKNTHKHTAFTFAQLFSTKLLNPRL